MSNSARSAILVSALLCQAAIAAPVEWRVVFARDADIVLPQLPPADGVQLYDFVGIAGGGAAPLGFMVSMYSNDDHDGLWAQRGTQLVPVAQIGVTGATGPGHGGTGSGDMFTRLDQYVDSSGEVSRVFGGDAGTSSADAEPGLWQWNGARNTQFAALFDDGPLGPGLQPGWRYTSLVNAASVADYNVFALPRHRALFSGRVATPQQADNSGDDSWSVFTPGIGNKPCMLQHSSDPDYAPGIAGTTFSDVAGWPSISPRGEVYAFAQVFDQRNSFDGIWTLCDGAPRPAALVGATGSFGPGLADATATFDLLFNGADDRIAPSVAGGFYFSAGGERPANASAPTFYGLFHHLGNSNRPVIMSFQADAYGPGIPGYVFSESRGANYRVKAAGRYAVLDAHMAPSTDTSDTTQGLWRITPEDHARPVALIGDTGAYAPAPGRTWTDFYETAVFDNGDILVSAQLSNPFEISLWRLRIGEPPVAILKPGDLVRVPTATGVQNVVATSIGNTNASSRRGVGGDTWYSANGEVIVSVSLEGYNGSSIKVRGLGANADLIFADGFE